MIATHRRGRWRGTPEGGSATTSIRLSPELRQQIDRWIREQGQLMTRSQAIRTLVERGLHTSQKRR
jgi:Arc/MetJ-type ribon-helix-helix transcriptional regulator